MMDNAKVVLNVSDVAKMLGLSRNSIYEGMRRGEIPYIRVGKRLLIPRVAFEKMLDSIVDRDDNRGGMFSGYQKRAK